VKTKQFVNLAALLITILTYNGGFRIVLAGDQEVFKQASSLQQLAKDIEEEFNLPLTHPKRWNSK